MLEATDIEANYHGSVHALGCVSVRLKAGQIAALLGPNGAGKSTLLKAISGHLPFEDGRIGKGSVIFEDRSILGWPAHRVARAGLTYVHEGRKIFTTLTVQENLAAAAFALTGRPKSTRNPDFEIVYELFPDLAVRRNNKAGYLSGGEAQMLSIGRALIAEPKVILLDEPSLGLAPKMVARVFELIHRINKETGVAVLIADQNAFATLAISDYGYVLEQGHLVLEGTPQKLLADAGVQASYLGRAQS